MFKPFHKYGVYSMLGRENGGIGSESNFLLKNAMSLWSSSVTINVSIITDCVPITDWDL